MMNLKINFVIFLLFIGLVISGCGKQDTQKALENVRTGTDGLTVGFLANNPPDLIHVENGGSLNKFDIILDLKNKGAYPANNELSGATNTFEGNAYISGYDRDILSVAPASVGLGNLALEGKSRININGGSDLANFHVTVNAEKLSVDKYEPSFLATVCYKYQTKADQIVCIEPDPYSTSGDKRVCTVKDSSLSSQGAPIAVTSINEEAFQGRTQFKINVKNSGNGDVFKIGSRAKCDPNGKDKLGRDDLDKVNVDSVIIGGKPLICWPFMGTIAKGDAGGYIRLVNGEGSVICELSIYSNPNTAYTTPISISLSYYYRTTAQKGMQIKKEKPATGAPGTASNEGPSDALGITQPGQANA